MSSPEPKFLQRPLDDEFIFIIYFSKYIVL